jgi:hypothetical protein
MTPLPLIVGFGGISPAGRSSCHQGYRRLVETALPQLARQSMLESLRGLSANQTEAELLAGTLIRGLESTLFDPSAMPCASAHLARSKYSARELSRVEKTAAQTPACNMADSLGASRQPRDQLLGAGLLAGLYTSQSGK